MSAFFTHLQIGVFFARHWKTFLVFAVESVFEIHCSLEGPYNCLYVWGTKMTQAQFFLTQLLHTVSRCNLLCDLLNKLLLLNLFWVAVTKGLNTYGLKTFQLFILNL
jgi:hypothetical protein